MAYEAGTAYISVIPSLKGFQNKIDSELKGIRAEVLVPIKPELDPAAKQKTQREGAQAGGAFADAFKARVSAALRSLPKVDITAESSDADRKVAEVRAALEDLSQQRVGIDIEEASALAKISALQAELKAVAQADNRVSVQIDTAAAMSTLDGLHDDIVKALEPISAPAGERSAGAWAEAVRTRITAAINALPDIEIHANSSQAEVAIAGIRQRLDALSSKRVGVDVDEGTALAELEQLRVALADINAQHPSVQVRADTAAAMAQLALVKEEVDKLNGRSAEIDVSDQGTAAQATEGISLLRGGLLALAPTALPISAALVPAIAGVGTAAVSAVAGVAVLKLGLDGISDALTAFDQADTASSSNASKNAQQVASAERSLAQARASAADQAISAAERVDTALQQQRSAEQSLADAQRQALRAQQDLTTARQAAARNLQDLQLASIQADLDQRSATLQLAQAQQTLAAVRANPSAAPGQLDQAQLALDQAQLAAQRSAIQKSRAGEDLVTAQQQGVEGSPGVVSAQDAVLRSNEQVSNAQQGVANAARAVTDAYRAQAAAARQAADSILSAQEAVANAQNADAAAVDKVSQAMAKLTPAGQSFVLFLREVKPLFDSIGQAAQTALLPGIQAGIQAFLPVVPVIRDVVSQIAAVVGDLVRQLGEALASPFWTGFVKTIGSAIVPALKIMAEVFGNFAMGAANVFVALLPLANAFAQAILQVSQRFLAWTQSPALGQFVDYVTRSVAVVWPLFESIGNAVLGILPPLAELGLSLLRVLAPVVEKLLPPLVQLVGVVGTALARALDACAGPLGDLAGVLGDVLTQAIQAVAPLIEGPLLDVFRIFVNEGLKPWLQLLGSLIKEILPPFLSLIPLFVPLIKMVGESFAQILPPLMDVARELAEALIPVIVDLVPIIKPLLESLVTIFDATLKYSVVPLLVDIVIPAIKLLADGITFLVKNVVGPMMRAYGEYSQAAYDYVIKPVYDSLSTGIDGVGKAFDSAVKFIKDVWGTLEKAIGTPIKAAIDFAYNEGLVPFWNRIAVLVNAPQLLKVDTSSIPHFAGGGVLAGFAPGHDVVPALLSPGEAVIVPGAVRALGADTIHALNAAYSRPGGASSVGVQRFASGGIVDSLLGIAGIGDAAQYLTGKDAFKSKFGDSGFVDMIATLPTLLFKAIGDYVSSQIANLGGLLSGGSASSGSADLDQWIAQAILIAGVPASWSAGLHTLIMRESGGNPRAINLWDSNAIAGHPSQGLMQTIPATFEAYRDKSLPDDILNPVANVVAGIHYIQARYGDISRVQQANASLPPLGYDSGGWLPPGYSTVFNGTGRPEPVFTQQQFSAITSGAAGGGEFTGTLYLDSGELLGVVRGEIQQAQQATATAIAQRSRG
ncbi:hypothetical protein GCM10010174_61430 [Kutzneria viridogrisea]|uniref:Phage-related protein n=1 Tax=Kutzneria viridogrisea TaxID=47990 RepID=A0ABR6BH24_9PSEU|nr:phage-related protein [Kutzneria viridogrisea]